MAYGKLNKIVPDVFAYNSCLIGEGGIGKTTVVKEMLSKHLGDDGYLFAEVGKEDGGDAISNINYINTPDWNSEYDELNNSVGFKLLIDDIIENKDTDYPNLRVLVVDTYDQLREIVEPEIVRRHNKEHPDKRVISIKAAFGGYMTGEDMADDLILDMLWELKKVGVHFFTIGHTKMREIVDSITGETYTQLTTDMSMRSFNKLKTKLHFLGVAHIDREIVKEKKLNKNVNAIKSETRKITFRDDNYALDSKSRFADIVNEIPLDADALYDALYNAIEAEANKGSVGIEKLKKENETLQKEKAKKSSEYSKAAKENKIDVARNEELLVIIKENFSSADADLKAKVKEVMAQYGIDNFKNADELPTKGLEKISSLFS